MAAAHPATFALELAAFFLELSRLSRIPCHKSLRTALGNAVGSKTSITPSEKGEAMPDGRRKRRHSANCAKKQWYAHHRAIRFSRRFLGVASA
jgi:hypothetical protein